MNAKKFRKTATFTLVMLVSLLISMPAFSASRIKDIADFEGVRDNQLVGYGMVVGLNGTGDNIKSINFAKESLVSLLDSVGINSRDGQLKSKNIAAVMVTANLPAFARQGSRIDVMVSALGDAKNLQGGTLIATPLVGANGEVYVADDSEPEVDTKAPESRQENDGQALIQALSQEDQAAESADLGQLLSQGLNLDDLESVAFKLEDVVANVSDSQGLDDSLGLAQAVQAQAAPLVAEEETIEIIQPEDQPL